MAAYIELENWVNARSVENAYRAAKRALEDRNITFGEVGWRAAQKRDPRLLKVLELACSAITRLEEDQRREEMRTTEMFSRQRYSTDTQLWQAAYKTVDEGKPIENLKWIYGAAAKLAGYQL